LHQMIRRSLVGQLEFGYELGLTTVKQDTLACVSSNSSCCAECPNGTAYLFSHLYSSSVNPILANDITIFVITSLRTLLQTRRQIHQRRSSVGQQSKTGCR